MSGGRARRESRAQLLILGQQQRQWLSESFHPCVNERLQAPTARVEITPAVADKRPPGGGDAGSRVVAVGSRAAARAPAAKAAAPASHCRCKARREGTAQAPSGQA